MCVAGGWSSELDYVAMTCTSLWSQEEIAFELHLSASFCLTFLEVKVANILSKQCNFSSIYCALIAKFILHKWNNLENCVTWRDWCFFSVCRCWIILSVSEVEWNYSSSFFFFIHSCTTLGFMHPNVSVVSYINDILLFVL